MRRVSRNSRSLLPCAAAASILSPRSAVLPPGSSRTVSRCACAPPGPLLDHKACTALEMLDQDRAHLRERRRQPLAGLEVMRNFPNSHGVLRRASTMMPSAREFQHALCVLGRAQRRRWRPPDAQPDFTSRMLSYSAHPRTCSARAAVNRKQLHARRFGDARDAQGIAPFGRRACGSSA